MIVKIHIKDPDGVSEAVESAAKESCDDIEGITEGERIELASRRMQEIEHSIRPWVKYGECMVVRIDTDAKTATVCTV